MKGSLDRRQFVKATGAAAVGMSLTSPLAFARGRNSPNEKVVVAVMGVNSRGQGLANSFAEAAGAEVGFICDPDERAIAKTIKSTAERQDRTPKGVKDFRELLDGNDIDALVIGAPDHWHAPATLMALQAGKHVYVEKPLGHNPREGEILIEAQQKYGKLIQMGTQQRSAPRTIEMMDMIRDGVIGTPYYGKCWYANTRGSIGRGKSIDPPSWLDYELWQGPAPRRQLTDNLIHYNWHWFWHWGTGESCNNGTHEVDICRWALGVDYPTRVVSSGGRYHYDDDWEFYDTQVMSFEFEGGKSITWEGRSCNGLQFYDRGRGSSIHGTEGSFLVDRDGWILFDNRGREVKRNVRGQQTDGLNVVGTGSMTDQHIANFVAGIQDGATLNTPVDEGHKSVLLCHLGNVAQATGRALKCDPTNGRPEDPVAKKMWGREYEPGWEMTV